ncbi:MAG: methyltransferase domain-containing protein [Deltaproteobacteria bacterium]|nr:MAG: methyltransferase domain-containing protein [Deltaproteobacteria bacterium]
MLDLAAVGPEDVVYDLGCGDGRIAIAAARRGAHAVGIEIDPARAATARAKAKAAGVAERVRIVEGDLYEADLSAATVVAAYLGTLPLQKLAPRLAQLRDGARVVSHDFAIPGAVPAQVKRLRTIDPHTDYPRTATVYLWTVPWRTSP